MTWKTLSSTIKYQNRYMTVTEDELITDHGDHVTYGMVRKEPFSVVIPWDGRRTLLVGQYRPSADFYSWEFPMGHAESDAPTVAAKRELQEETGLIAQDLIQIATFYPALGTMNQLGYVYVATSWVIGNQDLDVAEKAMQLKWLTLRELEAMITDGTIKDGPSITSYYLLKQYLNRQSLLP